MKDARRWCCSEEQIAALKARLSAGFAGSLAGGNAGVWPRHAKAMRAFLAAASQWRAILAAPRPVWIGLDYAAAAIAWGELDIELEPADFARFQVIEIGARDAQNERTS